MIANKLFDHSLIIRARDQFHLLKDCHQ